MLQGSNLAAKIVGGNAMLKDRTLLCDEANEKLSGALFDCNHNQVRLTNSPHGSCDLQSYGRVGLGRLQGQLV